jgi:predicted permease
MRAVRAWLHRLAGTLVPSRRERDMADELASHFAMHVDDNVRAGMTPVEARRQAILKFGPVESVKDAYRDRAGVPVVSRLAQDLRFALRLLRKAPAFSITVVVTIALAVGVNAAIFSVLNAAALQPLRVPQPEALAAVTLRLEGGGDRGVDGFRSMLSWPEFTAVRDQVRALDGAMAFAPLNPVTLGGDEPRQVLATLGSCEYFDVLRVRAALGRTFVPSDCDRGAPPTVVLSDALWRSAFAADPSIVSRTIAINRTPFTVIGVAPPWFTGTQLVPEDAYVPIQMQPVIKRGRNQMDNANMSWLYVIGRLRDGASMASLRADLAVIAARITAAEHAGRTFHFDSSRATLAGLPEIRQVVLAVGGVIIVGVALILLIACANIANLLLARSTARRKEFAVRMALGASRARVVQQLLTESVLLAAMGGAVGLFAADWATRAIVRFLLARLPQGMWPVVFEPRADVRVMAYAAVLTALTALAFGLVPALRSTRDTALEFRSATSTDRRGSRRLQQALVSVQVAVCLVLLVCAGLLARGLYRAHTIDPGLNMDAVSVVSLDLAGAGYSPAAASAFRYQLAEALSALPGARVVATSSAVPLSDQHAETRFGIGSERQRYLEFSQVSSSYFDVIGIPIVRGRTFLPAEMDTQRAAIVTESTARRLWPGLDPLTQALVLDNESLPVVGVARDVQVSQLGRSDSSYVFLPVGSDAPSSVSRTTSDIQPAQVYMLVGGSAATPSTRALASAVRSLDRDLAVEVTRLSDNLERWRAPLDGRRRVVGGAGAARAGARLHRRVRHRRLYRQPPGPRNRRPRRARRQPRRRAPVDRPPGHPPGRHRARRRSRRSGSGDDGAREDAVGLSPHDPWSFVAVPAVLFAIALLACYVPARRALLVEPTTALRTD